MERDRGAEQDVLDWLQAFTHSRCDGDWEHELGVSITMIDNPGWQLKADLVHWEEQLQDIPWRMLEEPGGLQDRDNSWMGLKIVDSYLDLCGGVRNLSGMLQLMRALVQQLDRCRQAGTTLPVTATEALLQRYL